MTVPDAEAPGPTFREPGQGRLVVAEQVDVQATSKAMSRLLTCPVTPVTRTVTDSFHAALLWLRVMLVAMFMTPVPSTAPLSLYRV
ncbi:hypothetical protein [Verrucosispora sioxanthis]|uniref:Uncharacterized protein n=1 Tax=Verrucosispora sioxanthis TaxID=2499994 RepID=A0A6M1KW26_9ACTN|nr:hypothetical protein [Verrucosispora sioxanthis]NEE62462.1 hypothetical protein [Verrucosispora sioxanthis]NGM11572.1 hypothetical protein [Verrucosispora sioxanthis]